MKKVTFLETNLIIGGEVFMLRVNMCLACTVFISFSTAKIAEQKMNNAGNVNLSAKLGNTIIVLQHAHEFRFMLGRLARHQESTRSICKQA